MSMSEHDYRTEIKTHAEGLEKRAARLEAEARELRQRAAWFMDTDKKRNIDDLDMLCRLIRLTKAAARAQ